MATIPIKTGMFSSFECSELELEKNNLKRLGKMGLAFQCVFFVLISLNLVQNILLSSILFFLLSLPLICLWVKLPTYLAKVKLIKHPCNITRNNMLSCEMQFDSRARLCRALTNLDNISKYT